MKRYITSHVIKEMQIKTIMSQYYMPIRIDRTLTPPNADKDVKQKEITRCCSECKMVKPL